MYEYIHQDRAVKIVDRPTTTETTNHEAPKQSETERIWEYGDHQRLTGKEVDRRGRRIKRAGNEKKALLTVHLDDGVEDLDLLERHFLGAAPRNRMEFDDEWSGGTRSGTRIERESECGVLMPPPLNGVTRLIKGITTLFLVAVAHPLMIVGDIWVPHKRPIHRRL